MLRWYDAHRRALPWRENTDPYRIWLSEIMLQQTRVAAALDHYLRFLRRFPTVKALASARVSSVLALWSGLGYYQRARRLHQAAKILVRDHKGEFPRSAEEWLKLPGIGRYTAAAIASIAFGQPVAGVDGNVERVLQRLYGRQETRQAAWLKAEALLDRRRPGDFNQAMMELGATICTPRAPHCLACPVHEWCTTRGASPPVPQPLRKRRQLWFGLARINGAIFLVQRPADASLMPGMWELPEISPGARNGQPVWAGLRHSITDTDYNVTVLMLGERELDSAALLQGRWFSSTQWQRLPLTGLARKVLRGLEDASLAAVRESK